MRLHLLEHEVDGGPDPIKTQGPRGFQGPLEVVGAHWPGLACARSKLLYIKRMFSNVNPIMRYMGCKYHPEMVGFVLGLPHYSTQ